MSKNTVLVVNNDIIHYQHKSHVSVCFSVSSEEKLYCIAIILQLYFPQIRPNWGLINGGT